jgi:hypothetical protein
MDAFAGQSALCPIGVRRLSLRFYSAKLNFRMLVVHATRHNCRSARGAKRVSLARLP